MRKAMCVITLMVLCISIYADDEGTYEGKHWKISQYIEYKDCRLIVDGKIVLRDYTNIGKIEVGGKLYFEVISKKSPGSYIREFFSIKGEKVIPWKFESFEISKNEGWEYVKLRVSSDNYLLYSGDLQFICSNMASYSPKVKCIDGIDGKFLEVTFYHGNEILHELYTSDWKLLIPRYKYFAISNTYDYYDIIIPNGYRGKLDKSLNWIEPIASEIQQFEKIEKVSNSYNKCKKGCYWGLYNSNFKEIIAPEYEEIDVFEDTNFVKFKLNGFWGVMSLQGNVVKTIIPTTRGYTNIDRYIKSQKRFTYTMNGYKGECNHLGKQLSRIKVEIPQQTIVKEETPTPEKKDTIIIKHDPVPMQIWKQCTICYGSGKCQTCGGTGIFTGWSGNKTICEFGCGGSGRCSFCAGKGGVYEVEYR